MAKSLRLVLLVLVGLLVACGGGSGNIGLAGNGSGGSSSADVEGLWTGTFSISGSPSSSVIYAAIVDNGFAFFYDQNGIIYVLPTFSGSNTLSGNITALAPAGIVFSNGKSQESFAVTGTVSGSSIKGSFSGNGETGTFTLTPYAPFPSTPSIVAGAWDGFYVGTGSSTFVRLNVQSSGAFVGNDANGCNLTGTLTQVQSGTGTPEDLFTATVDSAGCLGNLNGLAFESRTDASGLFGHTTGTYYYIIATSATSGFVAELKAP